MSNLRRRNESDEDHPNKHFKLSTVHKRVASLFLCSNWSDVTFVVGKHPRVQSFPGHRIVLSMSSTVFEAMFDGPLASDKAEVRLTDEDPEAFKTVLRYLYTDEPQLNEKIVMATLHSAKKYKLDRLKEECEAFVIENLTCDNVITMYQQVSEFCQLLMKA
jgi:hypothetical protein